MKKISLLVLAFVWAISSIWANPVDPATAKRLATNFWNVECNSTCISDLVDMSEQTEFTNMYIFVNQNGPGFIIMSKDDAAIPILGYSGKDNFRTSNMPENLRSWLAGYDRIINLIVTEKIPASDEVIAQWNNISEGRHPVTQYRDAVEPLVQTKWDQDAPYYNLCPTYGGNRCVTGCAATAMAQVMKFWNWPTTGTGSHSYTTSSYNLSCSANFGNTTYDWTNMKNSYSYSTAAQKTAVATLMYHCGVSIDMDYGPDVSGAYTSVPSYYYNSYRTVERALKENFSYASSLSAKHKDNYSQSNWISLLKTELNAGRPMVYSGDDGSSGHAFVCDGYNASNYFHFNWGWSGYSDGYFTVSSLTPGSGGIGGGSYNFSQDQEAIIGIVPTNGTGGDGGGGSGGGDENTCSVELYSDFTISPSTLRVGQTVQVSVSLTTDDETDFQGYVKLALVRNNTEYLIQQYYMNSAMNNQYAYNFSFSGTVQVPANGTYALTLYYSSNGSTWYVACGEPYNHTNPKNVSVTGATGIDENTAAAIDIFPNPARDYIQLGEINGQAQLNIYNQLGENVCQRTNVFSNETISISHLPAGIYFVKITTKEGVNTQKIIKQ